MPDAYLWAPERFNIKLGEIAARKHVLDNLGDPRERKRLGRRALRSQTLAAAEASAMDVADLLEYVGRLTYALDSARAVAAKYEGGEWRQDFGWRFVDGVGSFHGYAKPFDVTPQRQGHTPREATVRDIWYGPPRPYVEVATDA